MFWFHCGRCGALFQSQAGDLDSRVCSKCGASPELGLESPANDRQSKSLTPESPQPVSHRGRSKSKGPSNGHRNLLLKIIIGWVLVLAAIIFGANLLWREEEPAPIINQAPDPQQSLPSPEDQDALQKALPMCTETLQRYFAAATLEEKSQFVLSPAKTTTKMAHFYSANPIERVAPAELILSEHHILNLADGWAIETLWNIKDSRRIEAVFRKEGDAWKLDWNEFARYSEQPWALFLAGSGEPEGEFRLLARERLAKERKNEEDISVILYAPRFGDLGDTGFQSPEFNVVRTTPEGKLLSEAFRLKRQGQAIYQSALSRLDPDEMIRVRVRVQRSETDGVRKFIITRVIACHWYESDDSGIEVTAEKPQKEIESR